MSSEIVVAAGERASSPRADSGASTATRRDQGDREHREEREDRRRPAVGELRAGRLRSIACEPAAATRPIASTTSPARNSQPAADDAGREERDEDDGEAHHGPDPADQVERRDGAALEAERSTGAGAIASGFRRGRAAGSVKAPGSCPVRRGSRTAAGGPGRAARLGETGGRRLRSASRRLGDRRRDGLVGGEVGPLEVRAAPGAQGPVEPDEPAAVRAHAVELRAAGGADDPFVVHPPPARRTGLDRLDLGEQRLLGQVALVDLADLLVGPDDPVDDDPEHEQERGEQDDQGRREVRQDRVLAPLLHVAERPVRGGEPQDDEVDDERLDARTARSGCRRSRRSCHRSC